MKLTWLAWAGWRMRIPSEWRPLKIEDAPRRENMMVGTGDEPLFQVKWCKVDSRDGGFNFDAWLRRRLKRMAVQTEAAPGGPRTREFDRTAWFPEAVTEKGIARRLWYGYSKRAGMILEVAVNLNTDRRVQRIVEKDVLASADVCSRSGETRWSVFDTGFISPVGFVLESKKLHVGDMMLVLWRGQERLVMRQVYPAALALDRRVMERWLKLISPAPEIKKRLAGSGPYEWQVESAGHTLKGLKIEGKRQFRFPFRSMGSRKTAGAVVLDDRLGRLLMVEHDSPLSTGGDLTLECLRGMNWQRFEN